jgi:predicted extracellular nuclease
MKIRRKLLTILAGLGFAGSAGAHHALAANYDTDRIGTIEGVVVDVFWANPHVHYYLEVENDAGETELWDVETSNLSTVVRDGWTRQTVQVGDRIRISGQLGRNGILRLALDRSSLVKL